MNLRDINFSSRSVIPVELALPINRPVRAVEKERERRRSEDETAAREPVTRVVSFYL